MSSIFKFFSEFPIKKIHLDMIFCLDSYKDSYLLSISGKKGMTLTKILCLMKAVSNSFKIHEKLDQNTDFT